MTDIEKLLARLYVAASTPGPWQDDMLAADTLRYISALEHQLDALQTSLVTPSTRQAALTRASITCPRCAMVSYNRNDIEQGYCGSCHDWTSL